MQAAFGPARGHHVHVQHGGDQREKNRCRREPGTQPCRDPKDQEGRGRPRPRQKTPERTGTAACRQANTRQKHTEQRRRLRREREAGGAIAGSAAKAEQAHRQTDRPTTATAQRERTGVPGRDTHQPTGRPQGAGGATGGMADSEGEGEGERTNEGGGEDRQGQTQPTAVKHPDWRTHKPTNTETQTKRPRGTQREPQRHPKEARGTPRGFQTRPE